jgi:hypothetical protein
MYRIYLHKRDIYIVTRDEKFPDNWLVKCLKLIKHFGICLFNIQQNIAML